MSSFEKISVPKESHKSKLIKQIKLILYLARISGYDDQGRIRGNNGYIENSDIATLLNYAMTPGKVLIGQQEFINLLREARVPPDYIINDDIRSKLIGLEKPTEDSTEILEKPKEIIPTEIIPSKIIPTQIIEKPTEYTDITEQHKVVRKRKIEDDTRQVYKKPKYNWEIPQ